MQELGQDLEPLETVRDRILATLTPLPTRVEAIEFAHGEVLRGRLVARDLLPPFDNSAMDGFAVRARDLRDASPEHAVTLPVSGAIAAGDAGEKPLAPASASRIFTGAPIPPGADAVVPHELTDFDERQVTFRASIVEGLNIRRAGGDLRPGDEPLDVGTVLLAPQLAVAAALGFGELEVTRVLRVGIVSPGNELVPVRASPGPGQIRNSNATAMAALIREAGAEPIELGIVEDTPAAIRAAISRGVELGVDAFVSTGGASAGDHDHVKTVVSQVGDPGWVFKVAMRPGKPLVFGLVSGRPFFGLPGNPAAAIVSFEVFVRPSLRRLRGESEVLAETFEVRFPFEHRYRSSRVLLLRTRVEPDPAGGYRVVPPEEQDSSFLGSMRTANALVMLPADGECVPAGETRPAIWLGSYRRP